MGPKQEESGQDPNTSEPQAESPSETKAQDEKREPKSYSEDYVKTLRSEAASWRTKLRDMEKLLAEKEAAEKQAEEATLQEQAEFKELAEKYKTERDDLLKELESEKVARLRETIGAELNIPPTLRKRLVGTTEEEIRADAESLAESLPNNPATRSQSTTTAVPTGKPVGETREQKRARIYGRGTNSPFRPKS